MTGELALSLLAKSQSPQSRGDLEASNEQWRRVRLLHEARMLENPSSAAGSLHRKFRFVGTTFFFSYPIIATAIVLDVEQLF